MVLALALAEGGPELLASLTVVASLFYLVLALWLPFLRRVSRIRSDPRGELLVAAACLRGGDAGRRGQERQR
ncbi:MAG: hypothetical protein KTV68_01705 [Acidimicrobiia bacterium]|nr:hypothetical protein [Acidimicrobiia bacterium]MCY4432876.1 hypothetical protein [bacterium]